MIPLWVTALIGVVVGAVIVHLFIQFGSRRDLWPPK